MDKRALLVFMILSALIMLNAQGRIFDNLNNVSIQSSEHFNFLFKDKHSDIIPMLSSIAEAQYEKLAESMKTEPPRRINVILTDQSDTPNGFASVFIDEYINLYMSNPDAQFIVKHKHWLEFVLLHEMTHIFNLSALNPSCLKYLNNNIFYFPNSAVPMYIMEGYTVYNESTMLTGRLYDTNFESYLRTMILDDDIQPLDRAATYVNRHWPYSTLAYLYGGYLFDAYKRRGADLTEFNSVSCLSCLPVGNLLPDASIGIKTGTMPNTMLKNVFREVSSRTERIIAENTPNDRINMTNTGHFNAMPEMNRGILYFIKHFNNKGQRIVSRIKGKDTELFSAASPLSLHFDNSRNSIFYEHLDYVNNVNTFYSIYEYRNNVSAKLPFTDRGMYPVTYNDTLFFVRNSGISQSFIYYDLNLMSPVDSFTFNSDWRYYDLDINSEGRVLMSVWRPGGYTDIAVFDIHDRQIEFITTDLAADFKPRWSADTAAIYYISDIEGLNKVYQYSFRDSVQIPVYTSLYQVISYAMNENEDSIYVQDLSSVGYDIYKAGIFKQESAASERVLNQYHAYHPEMKKTALSGKGNYIFPLFNSPGIYYFIPWFFSNQYADSDLRTSEIGIISAMYMNSDVTSSHSFSSSLNGFTLKYHYDSLTALADSMQYIYNAAFSYTLSSYYPDIILGAVFSNINSTFMPDTYELSAGVSVDFVKSFDYANISAYTAGTVMDTVEEYGFSLSGIYSCTEAGIANVLPTHGYTVSAGTVEKMRYGSMNILSGINANLTLYFPFISNGSMFISTSGYWSNANSISLANDGNALLYSAYKLFYNVGMAGIDSTMYFNDLVTVKTGYEMPLLMINRGFPIPVMASLPVVFDYISWKSSLTYAYSPGSVFNDYVIESGVFLKIMASQLFPVKTGINAFYKPSEGKYGLSFVLIGI